MRTRTPLIASVGAAVTLVACLSTTSAGATAKETAVHPSWTISNGGLYSKTSPVGGFVIDTGIPHNNIVCMEFGQPGAGAVFFKSGSIPGADIGHIKSFSLPGPCTSSVGEFDIVPGPFPWPINATSYNTRGNVTSGRVTHIHVAIHSYPSGGCSAVLDGTGPSANDGWTRFEYSISIQGSLRNENAQGTVTGLHFYNVSGCPSSITNGGPANLIFGFNIVNPKTNLEPVITPSS